MILHHQLHVVPVRAADAVPLQERLADERRARLDRIRRAAKNPERVVSVRPAPQRQSVVQRVLEHPEVAPIVVAICKAYGVRTKVLVDPAFRGTKHRRARDEMLAQVREATGWSYAKIANLFDRDEKRVGQAVLRVRPATASQWTDELTAELIKLHALGASSSVIAAVLGVTRNAVIGKVRRLAADEARKATAG